MGKDSEIFTLSITTGTIIRTVLIVFVLALLYFIRDIVLVVLTAIVIASAIEPGARYFMKYRVPRVAAVLLVYLIVFATFFGIVYLFVPILLDDASGIFAEIPQYLDSLVRPLPVAEGVDVIGEGGGLGTTISTPIQNLIQEFQAVVANASQGFITTLTLIFGGLLSFILIIVFSFYFAVQETGVEDFLRVVTPVKQQEYILDLWGRSRIKIGRWMQGQLMLAVIIGVLTYLGLTVFGVPYALLLAILAMVFEIIPVFGPILASIPAIGVAFLSGGAPLALLVVGLYVIIQQFENHLIYPLVVKKVVGVPPLLVILAIIIGAKLLGFLGIILAVPAAAILQEFVSDVQKRKKRELEQNGKQA